MASLFEFYGGLRGLMMGKGLAHLRGRLTVFVGLVLSWLVSNV